MLHGIDYKEGKSPLLKSMPVVESATRGPDLARETSFSGPWRYYENVTFNMT